MTLEQRIKAFVALGQHLQNLSEEARTTLTQHARQENPWFTEQNVSRALKGIAFYLQEDQLKNWTARYNLQPANPKTVALVMAGNIPLVGFHDLLCVLLSGHKTQVKLSSKDSKLIPYLIKQLVWLEPAVEAFISIQTGTLNDFDAVIATGSDNSARYFEYYFGKYPNIIRKNRTSCAVLTGNETADAMRALGEDVFSYFGLGCRNVSKLFVPHGFDFTNLFPHWNPYQEIIHHHKYCNNYDYQKSILLVNGVPFLDTGFVLVHENQKLVSPISVLYFEYYQDSTDLHHKLQTSAEKIQCVVGNAPAAIPFGQAQYPGVDDYADQVDTLHFLTTLN